jgi:hypothetical protein
MNILNMPQVHHDVSQKGLLEGVQGSVLIVYGGYIPFEVKCSGIFGFLAENPVIITGCYATNINLINVDYGPVFRQIARSGD